MATVVATTDARRQGSHVTGQEPGSDDPSGRAGATPSFWARYRTWPTALRVGFAVVAWPFVLVGWLLDRPGSPLAARAAAVAVGVLLGFPWLVLVSTLAVQVLPVQEDDDASGSDVGEELEDLLGPLDVPTVEDPSPTSSIDPSPLASDGTGSSSGG